MQQILWVEPTLRGGAIFSNINIQSYVALCFKERIVKNRFSLFVCLLTCILVFSVSTAYAGLDEGVAAYKRGDYAAALKAFTPLAQNGNAAAQSQLGLMYVNGQGVAKNYKQAVNWFQKAAQQGYAQAQYNLGQMYRTGEGVGSSYKQAGGWFHKAAKQGLASAQFELGLMYYDGQGVAKSDQQVAYWWGKAADQGHVNAKHNLEVFKEIRSN